MANKERFFIQVVNFAMAVGMAVSPFYISKKQFPTWQPEMIEIGYKPTIAHFDHFLKKYQKILAIFLS